MSTVEANLLDGWTIEDGTSGFSETRVYDVYGLAGDVSARMYAALNDPAIPARGDPHPIVAGILVTRRSATPLEKADAARVSVTYSRPSSNIASNEPGEDPGVIEIGATLQNATTVLDNEGNQVRVQYTEEETDEVTGDITYTTLSQGGVAEYQQPVVLLSETRLESAPPLELARAYVGTVNRTRIWGYGAEQLLCTRIQGVSSDKGITYEVSYEFLANSVDWKAEFTYLDEDTGRPPDDLVTGVGIVRASVYPLADFRKLRLSFPN